MAAPSLFDGIARAIEEIGIPSVGLLLVILLIRITYGAQEAGIAYLVLTAAVLLAILSAAKYWNTRYTLGFVVFGIIVWIGVPGIIPHVIPSQFAILGGAMVLLCLLGIAWKLPSKWS